MATRKQSNPKHALGDLFAGPDDRKPKPLAKLDNTRAIPGLWSYADRQAYVDSRPGSAMAAQYGSHLVKLAQDDLKRINEAEAAKKAARDADQANWRKRY